MIFVFTIAVIYGIILLVKYNDKRPYPDLLRSYEKAVKQEIHREYQNKLMCYEVINYTEVGQYATIDL